MSNLCTAYYSRMRAPLLEAVKLCGKRHLKSNLHPLPYFHPAQTQTQFSTHTCINNHPFCAVQDGQSCMCQCPSQPQLGVEQGLSCLCAHSSILAWNKLMGNCSLVCWDWFVDKMFHFLDTRTVKERFHLSCQHHLADVTINALIICLQRELQPQFEV